MTMGVAMNTVSNTALNTHQTVALAVTVLMLGLLCYAGGRVHQYFKQGLDRDLAFRDGYNLATRSLFALATRTSKAMEAPPPLEAGDDKTMTMMVPGTAKVQPRHAVDTGELSSLQRNRPKTAWEHYRKVR